MLTGKIMKNIKLTDRQIKLLKIIVEQYINEATPISSKEVIHDFFKDLSSATIRNEMAYLEKVGLIEKTHTSSGRVPTSLGYEYYRQEILQPSLTADLKRKLTKIFAKRLTSIETIIDESMAVINETLHLPSIVTTGEINETLVRIDLIPVNTNMAIIIVVTSSGNLTKNTITFNEGKVLNDIATCVRIFNDRLVDTPLDQIPAKIDSLKDIIKDSVENYEFILQGLIQKIFDIKQQYHTSVHGTKYLTTQPEFKNDVDKLNQVLDLLDKTSI
ncbi:MAG: heat-inducible transcriptional repressor HrcA [Mycoplasmoidaceae bacterium]|nr:heat-inducible transcriptional repressor HrcA [Mycoplasmoidaceae bacterium]